MATELSLPPKALEIQGFLQNSIGELAKACPKHLTPERIIQVAVICCYRTPDLQKCDKSSLLASIIQASSHGFDLSPAMGEAYIIPRWNSKSNCFEAQFQPGYRGLAKLARQAGGLNYIQAELVYEKDVFKAYRDPDWKILHEPTFKRDSPITHVYAIAKLSTGDYQLVVMPREEVEGIRGRSKAANSGPWVSDWGEMAKKTAIKRLCKGLPNNLDPAAGFALASAIEIDNVEYEREPDAHHAKNFDNATGHGSGAYATPDDVKAFEAWTRDRVDEINAKWLDKHTGPDGLVADGVKDLLSTFQLAGHLYKWCRSEGLVNAPDEVRSGQRDKFTAVAWVRDRDLVEAEALRYGREKWREQLAKLDAAKLPVGDPFDGLTEDNFPEPGSDG